LAPIGGRGGVQEQFGAISFFGGFFAPQDERFAVLSCDRELLPINLAFYLDLG